jgi:hypothetical protein
MTPIFLAKMPVKMFHILLKYTHLLYVSVKLKLVVNVLWRVGLRH